MPSRRTFFKDARSLLVDAFGRDLEERRPWRGGEFVVRIHTNVDGICINGKGFWEFGCSERELGEGFGFGDPGSVVVVRVRLVVVYIFRRDRSDALRLGSHGDGRMGQIIKWTTNYFF